MDDDKFALVEKIIKDVHNVMSKNAELYAFDVIPVDSNFQNKSPVLHLENCLGLESWCVKHVYMYCYSEIMDKYHSKTKRKPLKITSFNVDRLAKLLNITLLLNTELCSLWNKRRELVLRGLLEKSFELRFTRLVLSRKPKCNDAFAYRRWLLEVILKDESLQSNYVENLVTDEFNICELTSDKSPNNYHSWNHRMWLVNTLKSLNCTDLQLLYIKEYEFSMRWTSKHISDFSCFHYRQFCIKNIFTINSEGWMKLENMADVDLRKTFIRLLTQNFPQDVAIESSEDEMVLFSEDNLVNLLLSYTLKNCSCIDNAIVCKKLEILSHELVLNNELLRFYKHHETLWYHRRFIVHEIISVMYNYFGLIRQNGVLVKNVCKKCNNASWKKQAKMIKYDSNRIYSSVFFNVLIIHEKKIIEERGKDGDNYAVRHEKYLKFVEGLNNLM